MSASSRNTGSPSAAAGAAKYVDAFMTNVNWEEVNRRFIGARKMAPRSEGRSGRGGVFAPPQR